MTTIPGPLRLSIVLIRERSCYLSQTTRHPKCLPYNPGLRRPLSFPKKVVQCEVPRVREIWDEAALHHYLTWTSEMQLIDGEFKRYVLAQRRQVVIFNAELHDANDNASLFVVGTPTPSGRPAGALFKMVGLMSPSQIARHWGIAPAQLPVGSRIRHDFFSAELELATRSLGGRVRSLPLRDLEEVQVEGQHEQQMKGVDVAALNTAIAASVAQVKKGTLSLIGTLRMDATRMECVALMPIKLAAMEQWMAISFDVRLEVRALYPCARDIVRRAALVRPDAVYRYRWMLAQQEEKGGLLRQELERARHVQHEQHQILEAQHQSCVFLERALHEKERQLAELQQAVLAKQAQPLPVLMTPVMQNGVLGVMLPLAVISDQCEK